MKKPDLTKYREQIKFNHKWWNSYSPFYYKIDMQQHINYYSKPYFFDDVLLLEFYHLTKNIKIEVGIYNQPENGDFVGYTIKIVKDFDWKNPVEKVTVNESIYLQGALTKLFNKYK